MSQTHHDCNLLFGILALQMDFISRDALVAAMNAWVLAKEKSLGQILQEQKALDADSCQLLEALVQKHLALHGDDPQKSLAALSSLGSARRPLQEIADADLQASLAQVSVARGEDDPWLTQPPSVGASTSAGTRFRILRPYAKGGLGKVSVARDEELHREVALKEIQEQYADQGERRAVRDGGRDHGGVGASEHHSGLRIRAICGRAAVLRHASDSRRQPQRGDRSLSPRRGGEARSGATGVGVSQTPGRYLDVLQRDCLRPQPGGAAPGSEAGQRHARPVRRNAGGGLGAGQAVGPAGAAWGMPEGWLRPSSGSGSAPTELGAAIGTPQYMSPEQAAGRLDLLGPASDVYSLGATLYQVLAGRPAFAGSDTATVLRQVQRGEFPRPREVQRRIPAALEAICLKAMALKPEDRYATPNLLADDVEHWLADEPVSAYREPWTSQAARWARRHRTAAAATLGLLLAATLGLAVSTALIKHQQMLAETARRATIANLEQEKRAHADAVQRTQEAERSQRQTQENLAACKTYFGIAWQAVQRFLDQVLEEKNLKSVRAEAVRRDLLRLCRPYYEKLLREMSDSPQDFLLSANTCLKIAAIDGETSFLPDAVKSYRRRKASTANCSRPIRFRRNARTA